MAMLEDRAFLMETFPCNSIPFLRRLREILDESKTNSFQLLPDDAKLKARACMWVLMGQLYGQMATIDLGQEWQALRKAIDEPERKEVKV